MAANLRTIGVSGFVRALVPHGRLGDVEAENLTREAIAANSNFIERLIASGRMGTREVARFASAWFGLPLPDRNAADPAPFPGDALDRKRVQGGGCHFPRGDGRDELLRGGPRRHVAAPAPGGARSLRDTDCKGRAAIFQVMPVFGSGVLSCAGAARSNRLNRRVWRAFSTCVRRGCSRSNKGLHHSKK